MRTKSPRVAIGGILIECNDFGGSPADLAAFERVVLARGDAVLDVRTSVTGGMLDVLEGQNSDIVPLLYAAAHPAGPITAEAYAELRNGLVDALKQALPVDGVLLPLHGSAAADGVDDVEGDLAAAVRNLVGPEVPIVMTLDLHASVTEAMVRYADAILGLETYPHTDYYSTGQRGARMLMQIIDGDLKPTMAMAKVPLLTGAVHTATAGKGPFGDLMRSAKALEGKGSVISTSAFLVHPHLDRPEMGSGALVITNDDIDTAVKHAPELTMEYWSKRAEIEPPLFTPEAAVQQGLQVSGGPVILVEAADCVGGGAAGDSVATLRALLDLSPDEESLVPVVDPEAAAACHLAGPSAEITVSLGHAVDPKWGSPIEISATVVGLSDGRFTYEGGAFEGAVTMGPSAVVAIGSVQVLITTFGTYEWRDEQFRAVGLDPGTAKFVVAKNPMNHAMTYGDIATDIIILDTPGPTPPTCTGLKYQQIGRPFFPFDQDIPGLEPTILQ